MRLRPLSIELAKKFTVDLIISVRFDENTITNNSNIICIHSHRSGEKCCNQVQCHERRISERLLRE